MDGAAKTDPSLAIRANAAVQTLIQQIADLHARIADMAGEIAVNRATIAALQQEKPKEEAAGAGA